MTIRYYGDGGTFGFHTGLYYHFRINTVTDQPPPPNPTSFPSWLCLLKNLGYHFFSFPPRGFSVLNCISILHYVLSRLLFALSTLRLVPFPLYCLLCPSGYYPLL